MLPKNSLGIKKVGGKINCPTTEKQIKLYSYQYEIS
jgi:hypothetical protein